MTSELQVKFWVLKVELSEKLKHEFTKNLFHCAYAAFMNEIVAKKITFYVMMS